MNIKSFKKEQEAYVLYEQPGRNVEDQISCVVIHSVGRKYVYAARVGAYSPDAFYDCGASDYLTEAKDWGYPQKLFISKTALDEYVERKNIFAELRNKFARLAMYDLTLQQLRAIKRVMNDPNHTEKGTEENE